MAAVRGGCTIIGADDDQWRIDRVLEQLAGTVTESPPPDREPPKGDDPSTRPPAHPAPGPIFSRKGYS